MTTNFSNKIVILGEFYVRYQDDEEAEKFFEFNDIGLPLAYLANEELCDIRPDGAKYVAETFDLFLASVEVEDTGFEDLDEVLFKADKKP